ncbi:MAG: family 1 glycosylhydrolase [Gemmatimonadaceae bacterium]
MTAGSSHCLGSAAGTTPPLELWGGVECTVNRVGELFFDQLELSGHAHRLSDLDRFAELGIKTIRYPVLWERVAPEKVSEADWSGTDNAMARLRELGIKPIVGLVHHGSGPRGTSLLDPDFPHKLREFAGAVAERYPWIEMVNPINEPLTTARFSALYGLWYPHARDDRSFVRACLNQCLAIRAAMGAIREVNPAIQLIQTEDLGKTYSTPLLEYQTEFENERRWLTFDLLSGRVDEDHKLWRYLIDNGVSDQELASFGTEPCTPDILGINHYLTGERFLDERLSLYPRNARGGNGIHHYADVEAVRVLEHGVAGHATLLREAWERYRLPLAITEVHLGCTREQQMRWMNEGWEAAITLRGDGCDIRAVTMWSLLGCHGWDSLLTRDNSAYESGAFDLRSPEPRATALAAQARALSTTGYFDHPALDGDGWWRERSRLSYPAVRAVHSASPTLRTIHKRRPILVTGARGTLGQAFARICEQRGLEFRAVTRSELDIGDARAIDAVLSQIEPWAVVNAAGYVRVDDAEWDAARCRRENIQGAFNLALASSELSIPLVTFSTDLVFDGRSRQPYLESAGVNPLGVYGLSKAEAEEKMLCLARCPLVIRTSAFFGPWDDYNFASTTRASLANSVPVEAANDVVISPTYVPDLVNAALDLLIDDERGIWHLANGAAVTWAEFARRIAIASGLDAALIIPRPIAALNLTAMRPSYSALGSERGVLLPPLDDAIGRYASESIEAHVAAAVNG